MVVDDHPGVSADTVQFGVDVNRRRDVPPAAHHPRVAVNHADVRCGELLPPQSPRIDEHIRLPVGLPGDVSGHVFGEPDTGQMAEGHRERLLVGQLNSDRG